MKIGIIGIGRLTLELALRSLQAGYEIIIHNPKGNSLIRDVIEKMGPNVTLGSLEQAAQPELIILFVQKEDLEAVIKRLPDMSGKIIVHTSGLIFDPQSLLSGITNAMTYKITASLLPQAQIVKLFNPVQINPNQMLCRTKDKEEIFFIADHADSRIYVMNFFKKLCYTPMDLSGKLHLQHKRVSTKTNFNPFSAGFTNTLN